MSNIFTNFLSNMADGGGDMRDYQHASRLYVANNYELLPKAGWLYYVVFNINPNLTFRGSAKKEFDTWVNRNKSNIGILVKTIDLPKFNIETETLNQYNKKTIIQKKITYVPVSMSFHDDMANSTTDLWKHYYRYYYADTVDNTPITSRLSINPKYMDSKYADAKTGGTGQSAFGLNNKQTDNFFISVDIYQLNNHKYTSFKLINPIVKEWAHDQLDQTQGNRLMTSKMTLEYEAVVYNTSLGNKITPADPGFTADHYDNTPSPISVGGNGAASLLGGGGVLAGASDVLGDLADINSMSPMDMINTAMKANSVIKNAKNLTLSGLKQEGYSILNGALGSIASTPAATVGLDGKAAPVPSSNRINDGVASTINGIKDAISPVGVKFWGSGSQNVNNGTTAATPSRA